MKDSFTKMSTSSTSYYQDLDNIGSDVMWRFSSTMTADYPEPDRERRVDDFNNEVARLVQREKDLHPQQDLTPDFSEIVRQYLDHLNSSLKVHVEPAPMDNITDSKRFLKAFADSCKVSGKYQVSQISHFSGKLGTVLSNEADKWEPKYHQG